MKKRGQILSISSVSVIAAIFALGGALPASATAASLPEGEVLHGYSYDGNHSFDGIIDVATGVATRVFPGLASSNIPAAEGAGYDTSTGKIWVVADPTCDLWEVHDDGTVTNRFHLPTTTATAQLKNCYALMLNNDNTAYVAAKIDGTGTRLYKVSLADGSVIGTPVVAAQIAGLAKDPTTGQVWAAVAIGQTGLYKIDVSTGTLTERQTIHDPVLNQDVDIWDMVFDSNGTLWMSAWGNDCILASIDPDAVNPQATYNHVAYTRHDGAIWWTDAMWISGVSSSSNSGVSPEAPQPSLASTGINAASTIALTVGAVLALAAGAGILILRRRA
jgi:hypothetical protein